jgi:hypothetical protein
MPRVLPRLLQAVARQNDESWSPFVLNRSCPKSLHKPVPPRPSFHPSRHPQSILLSPAETNPITSSRLYNRHKTLPPLPRLSRRVRQAPGQYDAPRSMSSEELKWWSNPYRTYSSLLAETHPTCSSQNACNSNPEMCPDRPLFAFWLAPFLVPVYFTLILLQTFSFAWARCTSHATCETPNKSPITPPLLKQR